MRHYIINENIKIYIDNIFKLNHNLNLEKTSVKRDILVATILRE